MKYFIAIALLALCNMVFADTLQIDTPDVTTTITGVYVGTLTTTDGPVIEFDAYSIAYTPTTGKAGRAPTVEQNWQWEGRFHNSTYDGAGLCYQVLKGSKLTLGNKTIHLVCENAYTEINEPGCGNVPCL